MSSWFKKLILSILASVILLVSALPLFARTAHAQVWYSQGPGEWFAKVYDPDNPAEIFGERYTAAQVEWIIWSLITWPWVKILGPELMFCLVTEDIVACVTALIGSSDIQNSTLALAPKNDQTLIEGVFKERPLSGITYFKDVFRKFKLVPEAQAQAGFGFATALQPVQGMWRASRDIAYALLVFVTIVLAFMVMFRVKLSPQTVVTVQSALPKLILTIILVTFSYAIAGLLVDLMYVVIGLVSLLSTRFFPVGLDVGLIFTFLTEGVLAGGLGMGVFGLVFIYMIAFFLAFIFILALMVVEIGGILTALIAALAFVPLTLASAPLILLLGLIIGVILFIILTIIAIKIIWMLLKAYVAIILLTIFAPFQLVIGAVVPGLGFSRWLKSFISNLAVFVVTGFFFLLAFGFLTIAVELALKGVLGGIGDNLAKFVFGAVLFPSGAPSDAGWPPLLGFGGETATALLFLGVSLVIFFLIPKVADVLKGLISGRPFAYGSAIGEAFGPAAYLGRAGAPTGAARGAEILQASKLGTALRLGAREATPQARTLRDLIRRARRG